MRFLRDDRTLAAAGKKINEAIPLPSGEEETHDVPDTPRPTQSGPIVSLLTEKRRRTFSSTCTPRPGPVGRAGGRPP